MREEPKASLLQAFNDSNESCGQRARRDAWSCEWQRRARFGAGQSPWAVRPKPELRREREREKGRHSAPPWLSFFGPDTQRVSEREKGNDSTRRFFSIVRLHQAEPQSTPKPQFA
ncbi:hypothetical protein MA16_Dca022497 [Dendrobium catenatum]|uniref:Uncharacterized protein n=1 Tax=Dendrobium catenatum TaxID=906689 RepID=A0A2I0XFZ6_9ASPA|nr:hypothetical protein MA16_Dca022497 [Dendrobium catenatum]